MAMFFGEGMADGREEQDGQSDEDNEAGQGFRGGDLGPDQGEAEPSALGVADLLFDGCRRQSKGSQKRQHWRRAENA